jgi:hypothetical protein
MRVLVLILLVFLFWITGCDLNSKNGQSDETFLNDSLKIDSLRNIKCDSLFDYIYKTNSGNIKLPHSIPANLDECIQQLNLSTNDTIKRWIKCVTEKEYLSKVHHGLGMYLRNNWGLWTNSKLSKFFNEKGIFHPDDMSGIILQCFHEFVNTEKYSLTDKIEYYKAYWKRIKENDDSLKKINYQQYALTKKFVDSLHKSIKYYDNFSKIRGLVKDSLNFYIEDIRGGTIILWISGGSTRLSKEDYLKTVKYERFGKSIFFGYVSDDGAIYDLSLSEQRFIRKKGSLYFEEESGGFVKILTPEMIRNPEKVNEWKPVSSCSFYKSFIKTTWNLKGKKYYNVEMQGKCDSVGLEVRYIIDEDLNVILDEHIKKQLWKDEVKADK